MPWTLVIDAPNYSSWMNVRKPHQRVRIQKLGPQGDYLVFGDVDSETGAVIDRTPVQTFSNHVDALKAARKLMRKMELM